MRKLLLIGLAIAASGLAQQQISVRQFFNLTATQATAIQKLNSEYNTPWYVQQDRIDAIGRELTTIFASNAPDPAVVGARALEVELIRRERVQRQAELQKQVAALLTPAQATIAQNLAVDADFRGLVSDAGCAFLIDQTYYNGQSLAYLRPNIVPVIILDPSLPYVPPAPNGAFCGNPFFPASVKEYLALSDAQIAAIFAASAAYEDDRARQQNRLNDLQLEIQDLTATPGTDPAVLGLRYAEMARIEREMNAKTVELRNAARSQLTPGQAAKVTMLQSVADVLNSNLIERANGCNLLSLPASSVYDGPSLNGNASYCSP